MLVLISAATANLLPKGILWTRESGIDAASLERAFRDVTQEQHHDLKGIVIVPNGALVSEQYFNGDSSDTLRDIRSAARGVTAMLMGKRAVITAVRP